METTIERFILEEGFAARSIGEAAQRVKWNAEKCWRVDEAGRKLEGPGDSSANVLVRALGI